MMYSYQLQQHNIFIMTALSKLINLLHLHFKYIFMGLSIHYSGRITDKQKLPLLIEELEEISKVHGWKYYIYETEFPIGYSPDDEHDENLYGISMNPPECEPVAFSFASNGRLCGPMQFSCWAESTDETERKYLYMNSTKTQYAGAEIHKMVIGVFRYVESHYLSDFVMIDEAQFWETGDENLLVENFRLNTELINRFTEALCANSQRNDEDIDTYLNRIIREFWVKRDEAGSKNSNDSTAD